MSNTKKFLCLQILKTHIVWHYKEVSQYDGKDEKTGLFTGYINLFLKLKIESSGYPSWVQTDSDRQKFIQDCFDREGIVLDADKIQKNPGLRSLAKLCLNSFWGKVKISHLISLFELVIFSLVSGIIWPKMNSSRTL